MKDLDWYDVETRIREVCESLLAPVAEVTGQNNVSCHTIDLRLQKMEKETNALNNAVFYDRNKQNNIFYDMKDQITQLRGDHAA